ncbi:MAG TPA: MATE family efflux transporter, partial [Clostridia bacterium]|nr:MATE family efflux transporter [Clostridia bacterium]
MSGTDHFTAIIFKRMWLPAVISSIGWALSDVADAVVVGQRMGTVGLAAIALILPVYMINCMFAHGLGIGGSVRYARLLGEGKPREAVESFNHILQAALLLSGLTAVAGNLFMTPLLQALGTVPADGALFEATKAYLRILVSATPFFYLSNILNYYLRNDDNGKLAGAGSVVGNVADIALNVLFVVFLDFGTAGAALSTMIGQLIAIAIYLPGLLGKAHILQIKAIKPVPAYACAVLREGFSSSVQYFFSLVFLLICNNVLIRTGNHLSVAVFDMLQNASYLILYLYEGTNRAMQPLVSTYHGEHREDGKRIGLHYAFIYGLTVGGTLTALIFAFPQLICTLFGLREAAAIQLGSYALRLYCVGALFAGVSILLAGYFQSCARESESLMLATLRGGAVLLPATLLFSLLGGAAFWLLFPVTEALSLGLWLLSVKCRKAKAEPFDQGRVWRGAIRQGNEEIGELTAGAEAFCERWDANTKQTYFVAMTIEEVCLAILQNGFRNHNDKCIDITLVAQQDGMFVLHIRDNALLFNPFALVTSKGGADNEFSIDVAGMRVITNKAKEFFYRRYGGFNS